MWKRESLSSQMNEPNPEPLYIRLPSQGVCPYTGLKRGVLERLCVPSKRNNYKAPVRSVSLKEPGMRKAARLVNYKSLTTFLASLEAAQASLTPGGTA
jgi:hypothetical protein